jgi:probable phosphoglycerate mutase
MIKHIYLIRHGEGEDNVDSIRRGPDSGLTTKGIEQASLVAQRLKNEQVDAVYSSTYKRAQDTARIIADIKSMQVSELDMVHERVLPQSVIGKDRHDPRVKEQVLKIEQGWIDGREYNDQTESYTDMLDRADGFYNSLQELKSEYTVVVSHAFFLKFFIMRMLLGDALSAYGALSAVYSIHLDNTGITHITIDDNGKFMLIQWNDSAHLGKLN